MEEIHATGQMELLGSRVPLVSVTSGVGADFVSSSMIPGVLTPWSGSSLGVVGLAAVGASCSYKGEEMDLAVVSDIFRPRWDHV